MKRTFLSIAYASLVFLLGLSACNQTGEGEYSETPSGLKIKYIAEGEGAEPDSGYFLLLHMKYYQEDSLLFPPEGAGMDEAIPVRLESDSINQVYEAFGMLKKGDSAHFQVTPEELFVNTFRTTVPPGVEAETPITFHIGVEDVLSPQDFQVYQMEQTRKRQEDMLAQQAEQMQQDSVTINEYLAENKIEAESTDSGLRYTIVEKGSGVQPSAGDSVFVHYRGKLLDGTQFDASYDRGEPFGFVLGQRNVIAGWDEGIALLNKGGKATLYVPSPLAYGPQNIGPIAANSILIFDVELVDVKTAG
uniref:Peptidyl-prolyl cis-trans isomerase n=1 Tax=Roseihalotalea indica TaxID=2867963 RepID=A0AA49JI37_9BACT|nr:FKBP-type peptidyl-prolyl cis-trans isomerase [Tunicatimonas sp. TK19036]